MEAPSDDLNQELAWLRAENKRLEARQNELQEAREALKAHRRHLETITHISPVGIFRTDQDGRLTYANERCREITGYSMTEVAGNRWMEHLHPEDRGRVPEAFNEAIARCEPFHAEYRFCHPDGQVVWVIGQAVPEINDADQLIGYVGTLTDISDRVRMEEDIYFRMSFEHLIYSISTHFVNRPWARLNEAMDGALKAIGSFLDVDHCYVLRFDEDGSKAHCTNEWCFTGIASRLREMQNLEVDHFPFSLGRIRHGEDLYVPQVNSIADQSSPDIQRWRRAGIQTTVALPMIAEGRVLGALGFDWVRREKQWSSEAIDLLRIAGEIFASSILRKSSMEALRKSEERLRAIFSSVTDAIFIHGAGGRIEEANHRAETLFGYEPHEFVNLSVGTLSEGRPPYTNEEALNYIEKSLQHREPQLFEWRCRHKDGRLWWAEVNLQVAPVGGEDKVVAVVRDITKRKKADEERRRLEVQIQHSQKLESLGVLAGGIAHDFNNLLLAILGNADMAAMELPEGSPAGTFLDDVVKTTRRAADLCNQLLAYSGKGKFVVQPTNLRQLVQETSNLLEVSINKKAILKYSFSESMPSIMADPTQISQILMNLITNASDALENREGTITISTGSKTCDQAYLRETWLDDDLDAGEYAYFEVADTGTGMDEETRRNMFDPFFTTKFTGRGLGLAAVLGIVRAHRGAIKVQSVEGTGTVFRVLFPACREAESRPKPKPRTNIPKQGSGVVMVVDDEEIILQLGEKVLQRNGYQVLLAKDGREAVECFKANLGRINAVILDLTMPRMSGEEAFAVMHELDKNVPIILTSGYSESETTALFVGKKPAGFIQKPYRPAQLLEKLRGVIAPMPEKP